MTTTRNGHLLDRHKGIIVHASQGNNGGRVLGRIIARHVPFVCRFRAKRIGLVYYYRWYIYKSLAARLLR